VIAAAAVISVLFSGCGDGGRNPSSVTVVITASPITVPTVDKTPVVIEATPVSPTATVRGENPPDSNATATPTSGIVQTPVMLTPAPEGTATILSTTSVEFTGISSGNNIAIEIGKEYWVEIYGKMKNGNLNSNLHLGIKDDANSDLLTPGKNGCLSQNRVGIYSYNSGSGNFTFRFALTAQPSSFIKAGTCHELIFKPVIEGRHWFSSEIKLLVTVYGPPVLVSFNQEILFDLGTGYFQRVYYETVPGKSYLIEVLPVTTSSWFKAFGGRREDISPGNPGSYLSVTRNEPGEKGSFSYTAESAGKAYVAVQSLSEGKNTGSLKVTESNGLHPNPLRTTFLPQYPPGSGWSTSRNCAQACLVMAVKYHQGMTPFPEDITKVNNFLGKDENGNHTNVADITYAAKEFYFFRNSFYKSNVTLNEIKKEIDEGRPVMVVVRAGELPDRGYPFTGTHVVLTVGYTSEEFICHDPGSSSGDYHYYKSSDFTRAMQIENNYAVFIW